MKIKDYINKPKPIEISQQGDSPEISTLSYSVPSLKNKKVLVYDYGLFPELAASLKNNKNGFGEVYYFVPWQDDFPSSDKQKIGTEFKGLTRVQKFWEYVDKADVIVCFDTYAGDLMDYLRTQGYAVWGGGRAEELELDRWKMRVMQHKAGMPTQQSLLIKSVDDLELYFQGIKNKVKEDTGTEDENTINLIWERIQKKYDNFSEDFYFGDLEQLKKEWVNGAKDKYVKNPMRGNIESFFAPNYEDSLAKFNALDEKLGHRAGAKEVEFIIEEKLKGVEPGWDGIQINGKALTPTLYGIEKKGSGYIGRIIDYDNMAEPIKYINKEMLGMIEEKYSPSASFVSTEFLLTKDGKAFLIDPCVRNPAPIGSAIYSELYINLPDIIWAGAHGEMVTPELYPAKYCAGVNFGSAWASEHEMEPYYDKDIEQWVKFRKAYSYNKKIYSIAGFESVCTVIGFGDTPEEAVKQVKERAEKVHGTQLDTGTSGLDDILEEDIPKLEEMTGQKF